MPDLLTHYALSLLVASRVFRFRVAAFIALAGLLPDVDVLFLVHRWVTHSLVLTMVAGVLVLAVTVWFSKSAVIPVSVVFALYATHIVMDALTSPTPVLWPLIGLSHAVKINVNGLLSSGDVALIPAISIESAPLEFTRRYFIEGPIVSEYGVVIALAVAAALLVEFLAGRVGRGV